MAKKRVRDIPVRRNPRLVGDSGLQFDNQDELPLALTDDEKADSFLSRYMERVDPLVRYSSYFDRSAMTVQSILKIVKVNYKSLVLNGKWDEKKYVAVVSDIFENGKVASPMSFDFTGRMYDENKLSAQQRAESRKRRNRL